MTDEPGEGYRLLDEGKPRKRRVALVLVMLAVLLAVAGGAGLLYLKTRPKQDLPTLEQVRVLYDSGRYAEANQAGERLVEGRPDDVEARKLLALALAATGDNAGAVAQYDVVLSQQPDDHTSLFRRALLERVTNDTEATLTDLERAVALDPSAVSYQEELAKTYELAGRLSEAADAWDGLLQIAGLSDVQRISALRSLALVYEAEGREAAAEKTWRLLLALSPNDPQGLAATGR